LEDSFGNDRLRGRHENTFAFAAGTLRRLRFVRPFLRWRLFAMPVVMTTPVGRAVLVVLTVRSLVRMRVVRAAAKREVQ